MRGPIADIGPNVEKTTEPRETFSECRDQGASKPFDFITANDVGDER
jgi:hypothetical protein